MVIQYIPSCLSSADASVICSVFLGSFRRRQSLIRHRRSVDKMEDFMENKPEEDTVDVAQQVKIRDCVTLESGDRQVKVYGWVHRCWTKGETLKIMLRDGTGFLQCALDGQVSQKNDPAALTMESSIVVSGTTRRIPPPDPQQATGGVELIADAWRVLASSPRAAIDHLLKDETDTDDLFDNRHLAIRSETATKVLKVRSVVKKCLRDHYYDRGYIEVSPPTLLPVQIEGTCIPLRVNSDYYGREVQLTMSSQMYLETALSALGDVYCIAPSFRAEPVASSRHLTEFTHCEAECPFIRFEDLLCRLEDLMCGVVDSLLRSPFASIIYDLNPEFKAPTRPFRRMNYTDAITWLRENDVTKEDGTHYKFGDNIPQAPERKFVDTLGEPVFLCRFPATLKPFYEQRCPEDKRLTESVDLLMPRVGEIVGGSMRMWNLDELLEAFRQEGIDPSAYFWYTDQLKFGACPHGGYGLGLERFLKWLLNRGHIREVSFYPRSVDRCTP